MADLDLKLSLYGVPFVSKVVDLLILILYTTIYSTIL